VVIVDIFLALVGSDDVRESRVMTQRVLVQGRKFAAIRRERYLTQEEFAQKLEMSPANVRRLEQSEASGMQVKNFRRLATLLNIPPDELRARIGVRSAATREPDEPPEAQAVSIHDPTFPSALRAESPRDVAAIPHYHGVSATRPEDRPPTGRGQSLVPAGSGRQFSVTVDGDCMEPKYHDRDVVIFSVDLAEREGIVDGKNYFIQLADGENTFKRIFADPENRELLILRCWNPKYPQRVIERAQVKLLARAAFKLTPDE
jgi:transcriptional regulator with XRE-family HTH domain